MHTAPTEGNPIVHATTAVSSRLTRAAQAIADPASFTDEELDTIYIETASIALHLFLSGAHESDTLAAAAVAGQVQAVRQAVAA